METKLINFWWRDLPVAASRVSGFLSVILADGIYLTHWSKVAAYAPVVSLVLGLLIGWFHFAPGQTFTFSIGVMALLMTISSFGTGLGSYLLVGYAFGDFFLFQHPKIGNIFQTFFVVQIPLLLSYALLSILLISIPLTSQGLRLQTVPRLKTLGTIGLVTEGLLQAVIQSTLVFVWTQAVPILIRPVYTWQGITPPVEAIQPLQYNGQMLALLAGILGAVRIFLEFKSSSDSQVKERGEKLREVLLSRKMPNNSLPPVIGVFIKAICSTAMLSGMLSNWFEAIILGLSITGVMLLRDSTPKKLMGWANIVCRCPILLRLIAATWLSYFLASMIIELMWGGDSFISIVISTMVGIMIFALLMPNPKQKVLEERNP